MSMFLFDIPASVLPRRPPAEPEKESVPKIAQAEQKPAKKRHKTATNSSSTRSEGKVCNYWSFPLSSNLSQCCCLLLFVVVVHCSSLPKKVTSL